MTHSHFENFFTSDEASFLADSSDCSRFLPPHVFPILNSVHRFFDLLEKLNGTPQNITDAEILHAIETKSLDVLLMRQIESFPENQKLDLEIFAAEKFGLTIEPSGENYRISRLLLPEIHSIRASVAQKISTAESPILSELKILLEGFPTTEAEIETAVFENRLESLLLELGFSEKLAEKYQALVSGLSTESEHLIAHEETKTKEMADPKNTFAGIPIAIGPDPNFGMSPAETDSIAEWRAHQNVAPVPYRRPLLPREVVDSLRPVNSATPLVFNQKDAEKNENFIQKTWSEHGEEEGWFATDSTTRKMADRALAQLRINEIEAVYSAPFEAISHIVLDILAELKNPGISAISEGELRKLAAPKFKGWLDVEVAFWQLSDAPKSIQPKINWAIHIAENKSETFHACFAMVINELVEQKFLSRATTKTAEGSLTSVLVLEKSTKNSTESPKFHLSQNIVFETDANSLFTN